MSAAAPDISVVVPSFNRREALAELLAASTTQTLAPDRFELIVVLDGSDDGSRELLDAARPTPFHLEVLWQPNQGAGRARNRGVERARGDLLVFLDDDVLPEPELLAAHVEAHRREPRAVFLGQMRFRSLVAPSVIVRWEAEWYVKHFAELADPEYEFACWDFFAGNVSLRRADFEAVGGFDEQFVQYGCEDWELGMRLLQAGLPFRYEPGAVAEHRYRLSFERWRHHAYWDGRSEVRFARRHPLIKNGLQLSGFYGGTRKRRLARRLLGAAPAAWGHLIAGAERAYLAAERPRLERAATVLAKLIWTYHYWRGMVDELGGPAAVDRFVGARVPILAYHRVTDNPHPALKEFAVTPRTFRRQLDWLRRRGYTPIRLSTLYEAYRGAAKLPPRPVVITVDDGYEDLATTAGPILASLGFPATCFVVADLVGGRNEWDRRFGPPSARLASWDQLRGLVAAGFEIGGHSATHPRLPEVDEATLERELVASRARIEAELGMPVRWLAYPFGDFDRRVERAARTAGYDAAFGFAGGLAGASDDLFCLARIPVGERDGVVGLAVKLRLGEDAWTAAKRWAPARLKRALAKRLRQREAGREREAEAATSPDAAPASPGR